MVARDRALLAISIAAASLLAWLLLFFPPVPPGGPGLSGAFLFLIFWTAMMAAMMLPSIYPVVATFGSHARKQREKARPATQPRFASERERRGPREEPGGSVPFFIAGYLAVWALFGVAALLLNSVVRPSVSTAGPGLPGLLLAAGGVYQFTPLKNACLGKCRNPLGFFMEFWRGGLLGPLRMGVRHGLFCLGCCWVLMLLLVVVGAMALPWVALLGLVVAAEKLLPGDLRAARATGGALLALGALVTTGLLTLPGPAAMAMGG